MFDLSGNIGKMFLITFPTDVPLFGLESELNSLIGLNIPLRHPFGLIGKVGFVWESEYDSARINEGLNIFFKKHPGTTVEFVEKNTVGV